MLGKILYVVGKSDISVLSPFLWMGTMTDSFHSSGSSSLFQIAMISLLIEAAVLLLQISFSFFFSIYMNPIV